MKTSYRLKCAFLFESVAPWISFRQVGEEALALDPGSLAPTSGGFLAGRAETCAEDVLTAGVSAAETPQRGEYPPRVVAVVGLAHANGVLARCAETGLRDGGRQTEDGTRSDEEDEGEEQKMSE